MRRNESVTSKALLITAVRFFKTLNIVASLVEANYRTVAAICSLRLGRHPVAVVQYTFTHKQYNENRKYRTYIIRIHKQ